MFVTETERVSQIIAQGARNGLHETEFFAREIVAWMRSPQRREQIDGWRYYHGDHDILRRKRTALGADGKPMVIDNLPNHHVIDNQYAKMVDQKVDYLLGNPFSITADNPDYAQMLGQYLNSTFARTLKYIAEEALCGGIAWMFVCYDDTGTLCFRHFPAYEILPFWSDDDHTKLDAACRLYLQEVWDGLTKKYIHKVELYRADGIYRYVLDGSTLVPDVALGTYSPYIVIHGDQTQPDVPYAWERFPLVPFKANKQEIPLIRRVRSLQDGLNLLLSDFQNRMEEDSRNTILILREYDGENLGEFRRNLAAYGAVKVRGEGGVESLAVEVSAQNYQAIVELFHKALVENARGLDAKDDRMSGNPNQMNIQSMYADIDLDANGMEVEFQAALDEVLWFIRQDAKTHGAEDFEQDACKIVFNRDVPVSTSETIQNCRNSVGLLSDETILANHPFVTDVRAEMERIRRERQQVSGDAWGVEDGS